MRPITVVHNRRMKLITDFFLILWNLRILRFFRRIRYPFISSYLWPFETCKRCGRNFRVRWNVKDEIWQKVMNVEDDGGGSLCVDCFIDAALNKGVHVKKEYFTIDIFIPENS